MNRILLLSISIITLSRLGISSDSTFYVSYDESLAQSLYFISDMEFDTAQLMLQKYAHTHPKNLAVLQLEAYIDFYKIFINERSELIDELEKKKSERLDIIKENLLDADPFKNHLITELNLQWSLVHAKSGHNYKAALSLYKSWRALSDNRKKHPNFIYDKKPACIIFSLVGAVDLPVVVKKLFGIKGSIDQALIEIEQLLDAVSDEDYIFSLEAKAIKACILFYQANRQEEAWSYIQNSELYFSKTILSRFLLVQIAQKRGDNNFALMVLEEDGDKQDYLRMPYMEFLRGLCKIRQLDSTSIRHFENYIQNAHGTTGIKEAFQKLAWSAVIFETDSTAYYDYLKKLSTSGSALSEADKQAQIEYEKNQYPDSAMLRARLLNDGGYLDLALECLENINEEDVSSTDEYLYRKARIYQGSENYENALMLYSAIQDMENDINSYIKCNTALQKGFIYECLNEIEDARLSYEKCLSIESDIYKTSLHQKARTALLRIKKW